MKIKFLIAIFAKHYISGDVFFRIPP